MYWYYVIIGLVLCGVVLSLEKDEKIRRYLQIVYFPSILCVLALFVGFRSSSPDYGSYLDWFDSISRGSLVAADWGKDPAFVLVSYIVCMLRGKFVVVALVFATTALASQFCFCRTVSDRKWITLFFYLVVCRTFIGSDMASIRSAVAIPLMSISIVVASRGKRKFALLLYLVALTCHLSVLIGLLPFVLSMSKVRFSSRWWIVSVAFATIIVWVFLENIVVLLSFASRLSIYTSNLGEGHGPPSAYYIYIMMRMLFLALIMMLCWDNLSAESRLALFCYSIGICLQIVLLFNNALSWRSSDIFGLFDIYALTIPLKLLSGRSQAAYAVGLVALGGAFAYSSFSVMEPYRWIFS